MSIEEDLADLEAILTSERVLGFPDGRRAGSLVRQKLSRFTGHVYLFPVALQPNLRDPIEVYLNGIGPQFLGDDVRVQTVGPKHRAVVVFDQELTNQDEVQARYTLAEVR